MKEKKDYLDSNYIHKLCDLSYNSVIRKIELGDKSVKAGEVIMQECPLLCALNPVALSERCDHCLGLVKINYGCEICNVVKYCSNFCKYEGMYFHNFECSKSEKILESSGITRMIMKLYHLILKLRLPLMYYFPEDKDLRLCDDFKVEESLHVIPIPFSKINEELINLSSDSFDISVDNALHLYNLIMKYCFSFADGEVEFGVLLYKDACNIKHSCVPNVELIPLGSIIYFRSLEDIKDFNKDKMRISFVKSLVPYEKRKQILKGRYLLNCNCLRCTDASFIQKESSMLCPSCGGCIPYNKEIPDCLLDKPCPHCELIPDPLFIREFMELVIRVPDTDANHFSLGYLNDVKKLFHPINLYFLEFVDKHLEKCKEVDEFVLYANSLLNGAKHYFPNESLTTLSLVAKFHKVAENKGWLNDPKYQPNLSLEIFLKRMFKNLSREDFEWTRSRKNKTITYMGLKV